MKKIKLDLSGMEVKSFVTSMPSQKQDVIVGGRCESLAGAPPYHCFEQPPSDC